MKYLSYLAIAVITSANAFGIVEPEPQPVPDASSTLFMFGLAMVALVTFRRLARPAKA